MELDVHLNRANDECWGFELVGGADCGIPLTIVKVQPSSPAEKAGLQDTDTILRLNGEDARGLKYDQARRAVAECSNSLSMLITRGLYDPVLDESEPVIDLQPEDFDQPSTPPTEVFQIQTFEPLLDSVNRSLTASPFLTPSKPYRPFSTEPLEVPPLEDPLILNGDYRDDFRMTNAVDDVFSSLFGDLNIEAKYKLPVNEKYDPDVQMKLVKEEQVLNNIALIEESICRQNEDSSRKDDTIITKDENSRIDINNTLKQEIDIKYTSDISTKIKLEEMKQLCNIVDVKAGSVTRDCNFEERKKETVGTFSSEDFEVEKIENTAKLLVEDSINRAVSVAEKIHEEIGVQLNTALESAQIVENKSEFSENITKTSRNVYSDETNADFENHRDVVVEDNRRNEERKQSIKKEIEESIEVGSVKQKSEIFNKDTEVKSNNLKSKTQPTIRSGTDKSDESKRAETHASSSGSVKKSQQTSEQRMFSLGLQTIPNIKGSVHSSHHYDLLLKTFFIHLTDVMVALSRFLLSEPASQIKERSENTQAQSVHTYESKKSKEFVENEHKINARNRSEFESVHENKNVATVNTVEAKFKTGRHIEESRTERDEIIQQERQARSETKTGAKMSQLCEKKTEELTHKMDAVISEFQSKSTEQVDVSSDLRRRSRSRSRIEEEVMSDSDPLDWLEKHDSRRSSFSETTNAFAHTETKTTNSKHESRQVTSLKSKPGKQTYLAVVEAHVYTNKDAILEDYAAEMSETASVQCAEEVNIAKESMETMKTENVAFSSTNSKQVANRVVEKISIAAESTETNLESNSEELTSDKMKLVNAVVSTEDNYLSAKTKSVETIAMAEAKEISMDIKETKEFNTERVVSETAETSLEATFDSAQKTLVQLMANANSTELEIEVCESNVFESEQIETSKANMTSVEDLSIGQTSEIKSLALAKTEQITTELIQTDILEKQEMKTELASACVEEDYTQSVSVIEADIKQNTDVTIDEKLILKRRRNRTLDEESAALKIVKYEVIGEGESVNMSEDTEIEIREDFELKKLQESSEEHSESYSKHTAVKSTSELSSESISQSHEAMKSTYSSESMMKSSQILMSQAEVYEQLSLEESSIKNAESIRVLDTQLSIQSDENNNTSNPPTVPATPLTDEYVFTLEIPLPKSRGTTPIPREVSPEKDEDPNIVKKRLIPHIETTIERVVYDQPLQSPTDENPSPVYSKPGLKGGSTGDFKEEMREIERKSSLLTSAIDETIKSIEEYKESIEKETSEEFKSKTEYETTESYSEQKITNTVSTVDSEIKMNGFHDLQDDKSENRLDITNLNIENCIENDTINKDFLENIQTEITYKVKTSLEETSVKEMEEKSAVNFPREIEEERLTSVNINENRLTNETPEASIHVTSEVKANLKELNKERIEDIERKAEISDNDIDLKRIHEKIERPIQKFVKTIATDDEAIKAAILKLEESPERSSDELIGFRPVHFDPEVEKERRPDHAYVQEPVVQNNRRMYMTPDGELLGTVQGIVDGLEDAVVDKEVAKELGKPGIPEDKIAELISGESEMLREAHVMGLARVLSSHMHRPDDSSVDFHKIKPIVESLKDSEVIKALNEELLKTKAEEKKKEQKKWTTFLQKPKRPVPRVKFGYHGYIDSEEDFEEPYKVQIVKQAKPKVAPDYKPEDFNTGPLPWEQRAEVESALPPVEPEEPILIPEDVPQFLEAVDPLPESEVPDLEDTGIPLPKPDPVPQEEHIEEKPEVVPETAEQEEEIDPEAVEETEAVVDMDQNRIADQLLGNIENMIDPNAPIDQQLAQMRQQLAALAQLPVVIQQTLEQVSRQFNQLSQMESHRMASEDRMRVESNEVNIEDGENLETTEHRHATTPEPAVTIEEIPPTPIAERNGETMLVPTADEVEKMKQEEEEMRKMEKQKKVLDQNKIESESRMVKQRPTPRVGKPKRVFGPLSPEERPIVLPGGRKWRGPKDAYDEQMFAETLQAQAELIQGKALGSFESHLLPYDERINFMKYEKPPVTLDHLQRSEVLRMIQNQDDPPRKRVELLTPVIAEADYRERVRSMTPNGAREVHFNLPQQLQP